MNRTAQVQIGDRVQFIESGRLYAADVTHVHSPTLVNLWIIDDNSGPQARTSVELVEQGANLGDVSSAWRFLPTDTAQEPAPAA